MEKNKTEKLPGNPIEAQGMLIKAFYKKFGKEAIPIIKEILGLQGKSLGLRIKEKLHNNKLSTVAKAFSQSYNPNDINIITISDNKFHIQGTKCPFGLKNTSRELCQAVMEIDYKYFCTAVSDKIKLNIFKTIADGDPYCDTIYEIKKT